LPYGRVLQQEQQSIVFRGHDVEHLHALLCSMTRSTMA
jgi:hypothetical protein